MRKLQWAYLAILLLLYAAAIAVGTLAFEDLRFTADGFHYFSAIDNFNRGYGFWEGPVFHNIFGNHSYLIFILLAPVLFVFNTPLVLLYLTITSHFVSTLLITKISSHRLVGSWPLLLGTIYFVHPLGFYWLFGEAYLFQPDLLLPVFLLWFTLLLLRGSYRHLWLPTVLTVATKEEYVLVFPAFLILLYFLLENRPRLKDLKPVYWSFAATSAVSLAVLVYFRNLNTHTHIKPNFDPSVLLQTELWLPYLSVLGILATPLLLLAPSIRKLNPLKDRVFLLGLAALLFIAGRLLGQVILYGRVDYFRWSHIIMPMIAVLVPALVFETAGLSLVRKRLAMGLAIFIVSVFAFLSLSTHPVSLVFSIQRENPLKKELMELARTLPPPNGVESIAAPGFFNGPFSTRSLVPLWYMKDCWKDFTGKCWSKFDYILLSKQGHDESGVYVGNIPRGYFTLIYDSPQLQLFKKSDSLRTPSGK